MQRGAAVYTKGKFTVYERVMIHLDNTREVVGYQLIGPGADSTWIYDLDSAIAAADDLDSKSKPSSMPGPR
ncbi:MULTISPECIES: hypothetical protein [unclassified Pseudomonas]|uniref:hypothetical protein n=1 Tax=unclassified Pseudomonas TaxID=196821 RepID=UPI0011F31A6D|nr:MULTISPECIES: hypothetical protein [unclassified Pseudomonas]KAA0995496.1 hypothetical protein FQ192_10685 [Pseudomonas sp. ANT_J12]MBP5953969.1 hypothetical protein [Pseudomonas sp. P42]